MFFFVRHWYVPLKHVFLSLSDGSRLTKKATSFSFLRLEGCFPPSPTPIFHCWVVLVSVSGQLIHFNYLLTCSGVERKCSLTITAKRSSASHEGIYGTTRSRFSFKCNTSKCIPLHSWVIFGRALFCNGFATTNWIIGTSLSLLIHTRGHACASELLLNTIHLITPHILETKL